MKRVAVIPTLLTLGNLFCGFTAVTYIVDGTLQDRQVVEQNLAWASWFIFFGMIFDLLDGRVARKTRTETGFGAQLDSLSDLVSFGLAPALLVRTVAHGLFANPRVLWIPCSIYLVCAAVRLARYNVRQAGAQSTHEDFEGLPTPGAAGAVASLVLLAHSSAGVAPEWVKPMIFVSIPFVALLLSLLMVSGVRYAHLASRLLSGKRPIAHVIQLALLLIIATYWMEAALALVFLGYLLSGFFSYALRRRCAQTEPATQTPTPPSMQ